MPSKGERDQRSQLPERGPVMRGSPLYRLLQMIAREVARALGKDPKEPLRGEQEQNPLSHRDE